jgi:hypothetical protein
VPPCRLALAAAELILSGLIGLSGRGTILQSFVAVLISFFFFALNVKQRPFKREMLNRIKIFSEVQLFVVLLVCVVLQTDHAGLPETGFATADFYGGCQLFITISILPVVLIAVVLRFRRRKLKQEGRGEDEDDDDRFEDETAAAAGAKAASAAFEADGDTSKIRTANPIYDPEDVDNGGVAVAGAKS